MKLSEMNIKDYSEVLAAKKPTPGGGSALALVCELALDLGLMVANFTVDKKGYEDVRNEVLSYLEQLSTLKEEANALIDKDGEAYGQVVLAFRSGDKEELNKASIEACEIPYRLYMIAKQSKFINNRLSIIGNKSIISDAIIGEELSDAVLHGSIANITCNIHNVLDEKAKNKYQELLK